MRKPTPLLVLAVCMAAGWPGSSTAHAGHYQRVDNWAQLPPGTSWGVMSAVAIDSQGRIYAFQRDEPSSKVIVFDTHGRHLQTWGENQFTYAHGLRVLGGDHVWATDRHMQQVLEFDPDGKLLMTIGQKGVAGDNDSQDRFNGVSDIAMAANGDLFVSDGEGANTRVVKFTRDGKYLTSWGTRGAGQGQLATPHCIAIDSQGRVWVGDRGNKRLQVFDQEGHYLTEMTQFGTPAGIAIAKDDVVYVAAGAPENRVTIGTTDGNVLETIDGLDSPHGIAVDANGAIYIAQSAGRSVLKYVKR